MVQQHKSLSGGWLYQPLLANFCRSGSLYPSQGSKAALNRAVREIWLITSQAMSTAPTVNNIQRLLRAIYRSLVESTAEAAVLQYTAQD